MATTVGETAEDFLSTTLGLGLTGTSVVMAALLAAALLRQFRAHRCVPATYWTAVVLISVVGTLITDDLTDNLGVSLPTTRAAIALVTFAHHRLGLYAVLAFWIAYVLTRTLGASLGDLLSQARADGGIGLGTVGTTALFIGTSLMLVTYFTRTRKDATEVTFGSSVEGAFVAD